MSQSEKATTNTIDTSTNVKMVSAKKSNIPTPLEQDDKKAEVIKWGRRNEYPYYLNWLVEANPIHSGIVRAKKHFTVSGGLVYEGANQAAYEQFYNNRKQTHKDKNLEDLVSDISLDFEKSNMFCFRVVFNFVGKKKFKKLEIIPFEQIRFEIIYNEQNQAVATGNIKISKDWLNDKIERKVLRPYDKDDQKQKECYVLHMEESGQATTDSKGKAINPGFYPSPPYSGGITSIDTLIQIGVWNNSEIHNGFSLGTMVYLAGGVIPDEQERKRFEDDFGEAGTGAGQANRTLIIYGNGQDGKPTVSSLQGNNLADRYNNVKKGAEQSIIHAHQVVVPTLFGMQPEGSFNASELEVGYAIMQANYFTGRRDAILSVLNWIMNEIAGIQGSLSFGDIALKLENQVDDDSRIGQALNSMSPLVANNVLSSMTLNEKRALAKLPPVEGGDVAPNNDNTQGDGTTMSKKDYDTIIERFKKNGVDRSTRNVIYSTSLISKDFESENEVLELFKKEAFQTLTDNAQRALELIEQNQGFNNIRKALEISGNDLAVIYRSLISKGLITSAGEVTTEGRKQIAINEVESLEIMYEYRLRPDAPALVPGGKSRELCETLIGLNRLYTRADIERISGVEGYDVFAYRGGWYHNPNTDKNEPGCRHEWAQVVTFR